jgi:type IV pilus assembly protein PilX
MRYRTTAIPTTARSSRGMALVISLILLMVMTVLGVTAVNSSIMQGLMSASYRQQTVTLAGAENLLLDGELDVEQLVVNGVGGRAWYVNLDADPDAEFPAALVDQAWPESNFVIEYMGPFLVPGESVAEGGGLEDSVMHIFRVSARDERTEDERGGLRIVQSLYVTLTGPDA